MRAFILIAVVVTFVPATRPLLAQDEDPSWAWSEERIGNAVNKVRAGRDLTPDHWPGGARVAVLLSFDVDNETIWLRNGDTSVGGLSQGQYGARVGLGRILQLLDEQSVRIYLMETIELQRMLHGLRSRLRFWVLGT